MADNEDSHDAIWASMQTVVVRDCAPKQGLEVQKLAESSDSEDSEDTTSDESADLALETFKTEDVNQEDAVTFGDLLQGEAPSIQRGDTTKHEDEVELPNVETAQRQLEGIAVRRTAIAQISKKYAAKGQTTFKCQLEQQKTSPIPPSQLDPEAAQPPKALQAVTAQSPAQSASRHQPAAQEAPAETLMVSPVPSKAQLVQSALAEQHPVGEAPIKDEVSKACGSAELGPALRFGPPARPGKEEIADIMHRFKAGLNKFSAASQAGTCQEFKEEAQLKSAGSKSKSSEFSEQQLCFTDLCQESLDPGTSATGKSDEHTANASVDSTHDSQGGSSALSAMPPMKEVIKIDLLPSENSAASKYTPHLQVVSDDVHEEKSGCQSRSSATSALADKKHKSTGKVSHSQGVPVDPTKLEAGREKEKLRMEELWQQFLAGDDQPVGGDLPPPDLYYGSTG